MKDIIEIPFGAYDSELGGWDYTVPEGFEAEIKDGKVIVRKKESEDERIRKDLIAVFNMIKEKEGLGASWSGIKVEKIIAYLEKQKEQIIIKQNIIDSIRANTQPDWDFSTIPNLHEEINRFFGEKFILPHTEDTIITVSDVIRCAYHFYNFGKHEQKPVECDKETETQKAFREGQNAGRQEVFDNPGAYGMEKIDNIFGFRIGDKVRLVDGDGRPHIIKCFEKIEGLHGPDFYRVVFEDNTASDHIIPGDEYPNGYFTRIEKIDEQKDQNTKNVRDIISGDVIENCMLRYLQSAANRKDDIEIIEDTKEYKKKLIELMQKEQPKEELVYRMNGMMQEYVKAGEDDAEREHRMKCYQLFWDALEDADFFEQKEQKPIFRIGDTIIAKEGIGIPREPFHIDSIHDDKYWDGEHEILICNQDDYFELVEQKAQPMELLEPDNKAEKVIENILRQYAKAFQWIDGYDIDSLIVNLRRAFNQKEQKPSSTEETELNSIAFMEQLGYTCVPPGAEQKPAEKPDMLAKLREHLANTPKEQLEKEWKELEHWNKVGPTVKEFLYGKEMIDDSEFSTEFEKQISRIIFSVIKGDYDYTKDFVKWVAVALLGYAKNELNSKSAAEWSEEDEKKAATDYANENPGLCFENDGGSWMGDFDKPYNDFLAGVLWAKSNAYGIKNTEWSEEDKSVLDDAICATDLLGNDISFNKSNPNLAKAFRIAKNWLKFLPERFNLQPKQEWHREDEQNLNASLAYIKDAELRRWLKDVIHLRYDKTAEFNDNDDQLMGFIFDLLNDLVWRKDWAISKGECLERLNALSYKLSLIQWNPEYREEDLQTRFAFYTYKDEPEILYLSNVFVEEASRNHGLGTRILKAAEKVAETIGATTIRLKVKQNTPANEWYRKNGYYYITFKADYAWLEKKLEYLKPGTPAEWSEEDKEMLDAMIDMVSTSLYEPLCPIEGMLAWLKNLPERFNLQPKQEWSEEDEDFIKFLTKLVERNFKDGTSFGGVDRGKPWITKEEVLERLKSLRSHWKPSEKQMEILQYVCEESSHPDQEVIPTLQTLYNDLKKL